MDLNGQSQLLRVFVGEIDKIGHTPLYEAIVLAARRKGVAGATVLRGILSYGASSRLHAAKLIDISEDLPIVIEMVDTHDKINGFLPELKELLQQCGRGGLVTLEKVDVIYYQARQ